MEKLTKEIEDIETEITAVSSETDDIDNEKIALDSEYENVNAHYVDERKDLVKARSEAEQAVKDAKTNLAAILKEHHKKIAEIKIPLHNMRNKRSIAAKENDIKKGEITKKLSDLRDKKSALLGKIKDLNQKKTSLIKHNNNKEKPETVDK